jgi:UDP-N-acetylmuramate--alanine ligase
MKVGIFFGGQSREREISFAGGRTVYDNLNKNLFEAVPVFVDSIGNFILLDWQYVYKGTIRDFYPPVQALPESPNGFQIYIESLGNLSPEKQDVVINSVGRKIQPEEFSNLFDFAFLALHGPYGEDGNIQGLLEWYNIPYSGSGILPSAIGINKIVQKSLMKNAGFAGPRHTYLSKKTWKSTENKDTIYENLKAELGLPFVVKAPYQGSSIGISVISADKKAGFRKSVNRSFFMQEISREEWNALSAEKQVTFIKLLVDIRDGIGMPVMVNDAFRINDPEELLSFIRKHFENSSETILLESLDNEEEIIVESFIEGREFSCIVVQDKDGKPLALPPTEIVKGNDVFDYRSKYLPGMSRKITPINLPVADIQRIRKECEKLFTALSFNVYARLDGFFTKDGQIFLNDPNTTSGMMPSSFFFHQAAEIGLNPSQFLTYIIRTSLSERIRSGKKTHRFKNLLFQLDEGLGKLKSEASVKKKVAVIMGGFSSERHISVESGRNIYEKLASSVKYEPIPVFLTGDEQNHELYIIPVNIMLKDNADDIKEKVHASAEKHPVIAEIIKEASDITGKYASNVIMHAKRIEYTDLPKLVDAVFIALHGRPGEDGEVQKHLEKYGIPYNGSGIESSQISINKYETNRLLRENGLNVANHMMVYKEDWDKDADGLIARIENGFKYPLIAKPSDDGCSSAVKKIKSREEMIAYIRLFFGIDDLRNSESTKVLGLKYNEEFPQKSYFLIEDLVSRNGAKHFLEITGGMLTHFENGKIRYEVFEPSEALATGDVLSLEEKFLAGEGQNITPARFAPDAESYKLIAAQVKSELEKTARVVNVQGYCRIDAFVRVFENNKAETVIIEINSLPGMTPATCIFHQTAINGYKPYEFIDRILTFGMQREKQKAEKQNVL